MSRHLDCWRAYPDPLHVLQNKRTEMSKRSIAAEIKDAQPGLFNAPSTMVSSRELTISSITFRSASTSTMHTPLTINNLFCRREVRSGEGQGQPRSWPDSRAINGHTSDSPHVMHGVDNPSPAADAPQSPNRARGWGSVGTCSSRASLPCLSTLLT